MKKTEIFTKVSPLTNKRYSCKGYKIKRVKSNYYLYKYNRKKGDYVLVGNRKQFTPMGKHELIFDKLLDLRYRKQQRKKGRK